MNSGPDPSPDSDSLREPVPAEPHLHEGSAQLPVQHEYVSADAAAAEAGFVSLSAGDRDSDSTQPHRGQAAWAWLVILLLVSAVITLGQRRQDAGPGKTDPATLALMEVQMKYFVGALQFSEAQGGFLYEQAQLLNRGGVAQRQYFVILSNELAGPEQALENLREIRADVAAEEISASPPQQRELAILEKLYADYAAGQWAAPAVPEEERQWYRQRHGWVAELAFTPAKADPAERAAVLAPARRTVMVALAASLLGVLLVLAGVVLLVVFSVLAMGRDLRSALQAGTPYGGIYAETFAVWLALFLILGLLAGLLPWAEQSLAVSGGVFALSLLSLLWPLARGVAWETVRRDIGWCARRPVWLEPVWGLCCYVASLPLVALGFLIAVLALQARGGLPVVLANADPAQMPTHPIIYWMREASWSGRLEVMLLACIAAPVVEETVFRGVLYRHLRQATRGWRLAASVGFSGLLNSLIFAAIHPQGLIAIPALAALALGFSLAREWRGSLIAPMIAHAANNFLLTLTLILVL